MSQQTLIVLYGGRSAEREVSVLSAESVVRAVDYTRYQVKTYFITQAGDFIKTQIYRQKPADSDRLMTNDSLNMDQKIQPSAIYEQGAVVFPVLHGPMGEDGSVQGFLEVLKMPYIGPNIMHASVTMDKLMTKLVLSTSDVPQVPYVAIVDDSSIEEKMAEVNAKLTYPVFVKPANMGSSVGISKVDSPDDLRSGIEVALKYDSRVVIEAGVDAREIEVAVLGHKTIKTTLPGEVVKDVAFYDYNAKYIDNQIQMAIPADLSEEVATAMRAYAKTAYSLVGGHGLSRVDFFLTKSGDIYLNELNAIPGFTAFSMYPLLWENMGLSYSDLISDLIDQAVESFEAREAHLSK